MATTGAIVPLTPGRIWAGLPRAEAMAEASSQTFTLGAPVYLNASGMLQEIAQSALTVYGIAGQAGLNSATDGVRNTRVYKISPDALFEGTLSVASWNISLATSVFGLSKSGSSWILVTAPTLSASAQCRVRGLANNVTFQTGDTNPVVVFSFVNTYIQGEI